jgi:tetratricopeptide (TPR) repeat protein
VWLLADRLRGYFWLVVDKTEWLGVATHALTMAQAEHNRRAEAAGQLSVGQAHLCLDAYEVGERHLGYALVASRAAEWPDGVLAALANLGTAHLWSGRLRKAADRFTQALASLQSAPLPADQRTVEAARAAELHGVLGDVLRQLGHLERGLDHLHRALDLHRAANDHGLEAEALHGLALLHADAGRPAGTLELADTAVRLARDAGNRRVEADALNTLATIRRRLGDPRSAVDCYQEARQMARENGMRYPNVVGLVGLSHAYRTVGDHILAAQCALDALALTRSTGIRIWHGHALDAIAANDLDTGHTDTAINWARQALAVHRSSGHALGQARSHLILGQALHQTGQTSAGQHHTRLGHAVLTRVGALEAS